MKVYSQSYPAYWNWPVALRNDFQKPDSQYTSVFLKPDSVLTTKSESRNTDSGMAFGKVGRISKRFQKSSLNINFIISQECKNYKQSCRKYKFNFPEPKYNPISSEIVPLRSVERVCISLWVRLWDLQKNSQEWLQFGRDTKNYRKFIQEKYSSGKRVACFRKTSFSSAHFIKTIWSLCSVHI
jgi:hypothetical protein